MADQVTDNDTDNGMGIQEYGELTITVQALPPESWVSPSVCLLLGTYLNTGFTQVMEIQESHGIWKFHFPVLESHGKSLHCFWGPGKFHGKRSMEFVSRCLFYYYALVILKYKDLLNLIDWLCDNFSGSLGVFYNTLRPVPVKKGHGILFKKVMESHEKSWNLRAKILCEPWVLLYVFNTKYQFWQWGQNPIQCGKVGQIQKRKHTREAWFLLQSSSINTILDKKKGDCLHTTWIICHCPCASGQK